MITLFKIQLSFSSNEILSLYSQYYAEACNEFAGRAICNIVSNLANQQFELQTSHSIDERVTARLTDPKIRHFGYLAIFFCP